MSNDDSVSNSAKSVEVAGEIIKAVSNNPDTKEAAHEIGKSLHTLTKTINNALLPLAAINFGFEKAKEYFSTKFETDIEEKASKIPKERLIEPKPSVAGPALQGLAFSHDEQSLRDMYLNLLASSMDSQTSENTHPAFVEIIKQMDTNDAMVASLYLKNDNNNAIIEIRKESSADDSWVVLAQHILNLVDTTTHEPREFEKVSTVIDNLIRLGLITVSYDKYLNGLNLYDWVEKRPEFIRLKKINTDKTSKIIFQKGVLKPTSLGLQFSKAVGIGENKPTS